MNIIFQSSQILNSLLAAKVCSVFYLIFVPLSKAVCNCKCSKEWLFRTVTNSALFHRISTYILRRRGPGLQNPNDQLTQHSHQDGDLDSLLNNIHIHEKELSLDVQGGKIKERREELEE